MRPLNPSDLELSQGSDKKIEWVCSDGHVYQRRVRWQLGAVKPALGIIPRCPECVNVGAWKACTVDDCQSASRSAFATLCEMHYGRIRRSGTLDARECLEEMGECYQCHVGLESGTFCSLRCYTRHRRNIDESEIMNCNFCQKEMPRSQFRADKKFCSVNCASRKRYHDSEDKDKYFATSRKSRAKRKGAEGSFTTEEWKSLCDYWDWTCLRCGRCDVKMSVDHVIPLSKGGTNYISNIQPLCLKCNLEKGVDDTDYRK